MNIRSNPVADRLVQTADRIAAQHVHLVSAAAGVERKEGGHKSLLNSLLETLVAFVMVVETTHQVLLTYVSSQTRSGKWALSLQVANCNFSMHVYLQTIGTSVCISQLMDTDVFLATNP